MKNIPQLLKLPFRIFHQWFLIDCITYNFFMTLKIACHDTVATEINNITGMCKYFAC